MRESRAEQALVALVRERGPALVRYAHLLAGDAAAAQDLVQDALVKVFVRTRSGFEPDVLEAYVRTAIVTLYIDGTRKRTTFASVHHLVAAADRAPGPEEGTADRLDLRAALATLAPQERTCVVLRYFEDRSIAEIADAMGLATGTVKRYLSNAVGKLETRLGPMPSLHAEDADVLTTARVHGRS